MSKQNALDLQNITVTYNNTVALEDVSFAIPQGLLVGIVGPNGAGKSTLLKTIMDLIKPTKGSITILDKPYKKIYKKIAYVPQRVSVDWDFPINVYDVVMMGRYGHLGWFRCPGKDDKKIVLDALQKVGMLKLQDRHISELSGGQQQRVFLARALAQQADVYLLDEPFSGVDAQTEVAILNILKQLSSCAKASADQSYSGKTVIVVHHDLNTVNAYFNWVILLNKKLIAAGPIKEVLTSENIGRTYGIGKAFGLLCNDINHGKSS